MHHTLRSFLVVCALIPSITGCYTTKIRTRAAGSGAQHEQRQWFLIAGLIPLSSPAGDECPGGLVSAESELSGMDVLIQLGLTASGVLLANSQCDATSESYSSCVSGWMLVPNLFGTRTVTYTCSGTPSG